MEIWLMGAKEFLVERKEENDDLMLLIHVLIWVPLLKNLNRNKAFILVGERLATYKHS
jgi:hypothetical protein